MEIDFREIDPKLRYKLLISTVIPRPIALVSTRGPEGIDNLAPFSFFNVFGEDPPLVVLGLQAKEPGSPKDTTRNIRVTNCLLYTSPSLRDRQKSRMPSSA